MRGLDLFSGVGCNGLALAPWVQPVCYVEVEPYCQAVLIERMSEGRLRLAPVWDDVRTLTRADVSGKVDIVVGGFPCQDISVAGRGAGLDGERSGLFFEVERLVREFKPAFVFLENSPALRTRGGEVVGKRLAALGYDCRWDTLSAASVGAAHIRNRWFLLAYANCTRLEERQGKRRDHGAQLSASVGVSGRSHQSHLGRAFYEVAGRVDGDWESGVPRTAPSKPGRKDRIHALGNAVVPLQAREAFLRLSGLKSSNTTEGVAP